MKSNAKKINFGLFPDLKILELDGIYLERFNFSPPFSKRTEHPLKKCSINVWSSDAFYCLPVSLVSLKCLNEFNHTYISLGTNSIEMLYGMHQNFISKMKNGFMKRLSISSEEFMDMFPAKKSTTSVILDKDKLHRPTLLEICARFVIIHLYGRERETINV